jgi:hypothetical protein
VHLAHYLGFAHRSELALGEAFREVAGNHAEEAAVLHIAQRLAGQCEEHATRLRPFADRYGGSTATSSRAPAKARWGCCGTCTTST